jgi:hypothetical protein
MSTDGWRQLLFRRDLIGGFAGILRAKYLAKTDTYGANSEPYTAHHLLRPKTSDIIQHELAHRIADDRLRHDGRRRGPR